MIVSASFFIVGGTEQGLLEDVDKWVCAGKQGQRRANMDRRTMIDYDIDERRW
jgi:hypothetical protein